MPPKKRKAASTSNSSTPAKKVRIGSASNIPDPQLPSLSATGRPKRASAGEPLYNLTKTRRPSAQKDTSIPSPPPAEPRKRGRPPKTSPVPQAAEKAASTEKAPAKKGKVARQVSEVNVAVKPSKVTPIKRGRKPEAQSNAIALDAKDGKSVTQANHEAPKAEVVEGIDQDIQYWLMKAEPESRIERGRDVKFSIDDLAAKSEPEGWDGVRNAGARNNMRAMRKGDLAFFYHSNCSTPGVAGVMRIVEEHVVDESAFDPDHPYYDPKSDREKPKWEMVRVEFVKKFEQLVPLKQLRSLGGPGGALQNMMMLKQGRLSVSPVASDEWHFILNLAGEKPSLGHPTPKDGYESDIDSEGDGEANGGDINGGTDISASEDESNGLTSGIANGREREAAKTVEDEAELSD